jgi:hypothetical protein
MGIRRVSLTDEVGMYSMIQYLALDSESLMEQYISISCCSNLRRIIRDASLIVILSLNEYSLSSNLFNKMLALS